MRNYTPDLPTVARLVATGNTWPSDTHEIVPPQRAHYLGTFDHTGERVTLKLARWLAHDGQTYVIDIDPGGLAEGPTRVFVTGDLWSESDAWQALQDAAWDMPAPDENRWNLGSVMWQPCDAHDCWCGAGDFAETRRRPDGTRCHFMGQDVLAVQKVTPEQVHDQGMSLRRKLRKAERDAQKIRQAETVAQIRAENEAAHARRIERGQA